MEFVHIGNQSAAVKAGVRCVAAPPVGSAYQADRIERDIVGLCQAEPGDRLSDISFRDGRRIWGRTATSAEYGNG